MGLFAFNRARLAQGGADKAPSADEATKQVQGGKPASPKPPKPPRKPGGRKKKGVTDDKPDQ